MNTTQNLRRSCLWRSTLTLLLASSVCYGAEGDDYTDKQIYRARPEPNREVPFGHIGVTGVMVRVYRGVTVTVESTVPGSPSASQTSCLVASQPELGEAAKTAV